MSYPQTGLTVKIVFASERDGYAQIEMEPDGSNVPADLQLGAGHVPGLSADGSQIVFTSGYVMNADGTNQVPEGNLHEGHGGQT